MASAKVIWRIIKFFFRKIPIESSLSGLVYILENLHPTMMTLLSAVLFEEAESCLAGNGQTARLYGYTMIIILYFVLYNIMRSVSSICINAGVYEKAMHLLKDDMAAAASGLPLVRFEDGEMLARRKRAEECVQNERIPGIFMLLIVLTTSIAGIVSLLAVLGSYHPLLPAVAAVSVIQFFVSNWLLERERYAMEAAVTQGKRKRDYIWSLFTDLGKVREMRVMGFAGYLADRWKAERDRVNEAQWRLDRKKSRYHLLCNAVKTFGYLTGVMLCLWLLREGAISVPVFGACLAAFAGVQDVVGNFFDSAGKIPGFTSLAADYFSFIDSSISEKEDPAGLQELPGEIRHIEMKNVSFRYPHREKEAVRSVSLTIGQGEVVSIVGTNGSGKTTLVKLLLGIYAPERGEVSCNGINLRMLDKESLYRHTALLTQDFTLYSLSLEENIALADIERLGDRERIREALRQVDMEGALGEAEEHGDRGDREGCGGHKGRGDHKDYGTREGCGGHKGRGDHKDYGTREGCGSHRGCRNHGDRGDREGCGGHKGRGDHKDYGTRKSCGSHRGCGNHGDHRTREEHGRILGREFGGPAFSEGQKQRLALARVLFADRELVILDEPTSALDPLQENRILEEFLRLARGRTTIIISHRVGLCRQADRIAVMQCGSIVECGSHEELMAKGGEYQKLYDMQRKWYTDTADACSGGRGGQS